MLPLPSALPASPVAEAVCHWAKLAYRRLPLFLCCWAILQATGWAQSEYEHDPINYVSRTPTDRIQQLADAIQNGDTQLQWDEQHGWLPSLLEHLDVPVSSQTLVFSKTSLQIRRITPARPRAIYFNDDIYVGWVQQGDLVELSAVDKQQGAIFYKIKQEQMDRPHIVRSSGECMSCHGTARTQRVPGYLVRSVYPKRTGAPEYRLGTTTTDHRTDFQERFGGWYVTGQHGEMTHRGNALLTGSRDAPTLDTQASHNLLQLPDSVQADRYLTDTSDIVALMVLEHQTQMHNWITRASFTARTALHQQALMNKVLERDANFQSESTQRRIASVSEKLLQYLLFCDEFALTDVVRGNSDFTAEFTALGPRDQDGRSLRDLDLQQRLFRYPCSFLIYSESFLALPKPVLQHVTQRMREVLSGEDDSAKFSHLTESDRENILAILRQTHPLFREGEPLIDADER